MDHRTEPSVIAAAMVVVMAAVVGGAFLPAPRLLIGVGFALVWVLAALEWRGSLDTVETAWLALVGWGVGSALWVGAAPLASKETLVTWLVAWALWSLSRRGSAEAGAIGLRILAVGGALVAVAVVFVAASETHLRVGGLFENPNIAAAILVPTLAVGLVVFEDDPPWRRWIWFAVMGMGVVLTGSRAGLLAAVAAAAVLLPRGRMRLFGVVTGGGLAGAVLTWRFISQPDILAWHRTSIWWAVVKIWASRPWTGVGPGSLIEAAGPERILHTEQIGRYQFVVSYAESTPLAILVQLGLVGLVVAAIAAGLWLVDAQRSGALDSAPLRAGLVAMVVYGLFHDLLTADPVLWWWAVLIGCFSALGRKPHPSVAVGSPTGVRLAIALAAIWLTAWGIVAPATARLLWSSGDPTKANVGRALRAEPWYSTPPGERVRGLLEVPDRWSWAEAAEALHWARSARTVHPGLARRWADLGRVHLRIVTDLGGTNHDVEAATRALDRACELDPHLPWHWLERARLARVIGETERAVGLTRHALAQEPNTVRGWLFLSRLELELGRAEAAREALAEAEVRGRLADRPSLEHYERELLFSPVSQIRALQEALAAETPDTD